MIKSNDRLKRLTLDIETSAHVVSAWGLFNQNIGLNQLKEPTRMLSFAAKWYDNPRTAFFSEYHHGRDKMVRAAWALVNEADAVIHFNGKGFDMKHLNREFQEVRLGPPSSYHHIDLLSVVKKNFRLASNKLDYVAQWLNVGAKVQHPGMDLWNECLKGNPKAWALMRRYNVGDVLITESVYRELLAWIDGHPNMQLYVDAEGTVCPQCGAVDTLTRQGSRTTGLGRYPRFKCTACRRWSQGKKSERLADER